MSFLTSTDSSNSEIFVDVWLSLEKSIAEFSMAYKKMSALIWLWVYNHDFDLQLDQIHKICLDIWDVLLCLSVWRACLVICKPAKKRYVMRMCISWLCPCKGKNISCSSLIYPPFISYFTSATTTLNLLPSIPLGVDKLCLFRRILSNITTPGLVNWLHVPIYGQVNKPTMLMKMTTKIH